MSKINVGDTVQVIGGCCANFDEIMWAYSVAEYITPPTTVISMGCGTILENMRLVVLTIKDLKAQIPICYLRKVPPLDELEKQSTPESIIEKINRDPLVKAPHYD